MKKTKYTYAMERMEIKKAHPGDNPDDCLPVKTYRYLHGASLFVSDKMMHYHTKKYESELTEAGSMIKIGNSVYLHQHRFFADYQRINASK